MSGYSNSSYAINRDEDDTPARPLSLDGRSAFANAKLVNSADGPKLAEVSGVEIFSAGTHRDKPYTVDDLDEMAENFDQLAELLKPPIVVGHEEDQSFLENSGYPAAGRLSKVWRDGEILKADFADVPLSIAKLINGRAYNHVSAEVYDDFEHEGKHYGKALRRVALLGGELPQIKTLADLPLADYSERPAKTATLKFTKRIVRPLAGTFIAFSEVKPMAPTATPPAKPKRQKLQKFSDRCKAAWKKFADEPAMPDQAAPPPQGVSRDDMLAMLTEYGFDPSVLEKIPDEGLAEIIRVYKTQMGQMAEVPAAPQPGATMADATIQTPPVAAAPAPAAIQTAQTTGAPQQPSQVVIKYADKELTISKETHEALQFMLKPITDQLQAAHQSVEKFQESQKKAGIDAKLDLLSKQGKVLPAELDGPNNLREQLYRANGVTKFSDGQTELDKQIALLDARPQLLKMSELVKGSRGKIGSADQEIEKVQRFAEQDASFNRALSAVGKKPEDYVADFKKARDKRPALTAQEYGVPAQYLN